jgi:hypothetical protein
LRRNVRALEIGQRATPGAEEDIERLAQACHEPLDRATFERVTEQLVGRHAGCHQLAKRRGESGCRDSGGGEDLPISIQLAPGEPAQRLDDDLFHQCLCP